MLCEILPVGFILSILVTLYEMFLEFHTLSVIVIIHVPFELTNLLVDALLQPAPLSLQATLIVTSQLVHMLGEYETVPFGPVLSITRVNVETPLHHAISQVFALKYCF